MKRNPVLFLLALAVMTVTVMNFPRTASSNSSTPKPSSTFGHVGPTIASGSTVDQRGRSHTVDDPAVVNSANDGTDIGAFEAEVACILTSPIDIVVANDPNQCGAIVDYGTPAGTGCGTVICDRPSGSFFPIGETTVVCTCSAGPATSFKVSVNDMQGPTISAVGTDISLPPNHKYTTIYLSDLVSSVVDNCDATVGVSSLVIVKVTSDESDNRDGEGTTYQDILIAPNCKSVKLRAERSGIGNGRVYTITLKATDSSGNSTTATAKVTVPKSPNGTPAIDDGVRQTVLGGCP